MGLKEILCGTLLTISFALGVSIRGFFINTPDCSLKVYRKPTGSIDTLKTKTNIDGKWAILTENFVPEAQQGETLYVEDNAKRAKTFLVRGPPEYTSLDLNLNKHTGCIKDVNDFTNVNAPLKLIYWINGFAPETTEVDTGYNQGFTFYYDIHAPFDTLQAVQGAQAHFRLEKVRADTTFYRNLDFVIDKTRFNAQLVRDTIYLTRDSFVIGVAEEKGLENKVKNDFEVYPSHGNIFKTNYRGKVSVYDETGRKVGVSMIQDGKINLAYLSKGIYFIKPEDSDGDVEKVVRVE